MKIFIALIYLEICDNIHVLTMNNGENERGQHAEPVYDIL
jgi:hypothetical protein